MKNLVIALCLLICCSACELSEQVELSINYRPTLWMHYSLLNNQHQDVVNERVKQMTCFVFDEKGKLFIQEVIPVDSLSLGSGTRLLHGVPDGKYQVCSFANGLPSTGEDFPPIVDSMDSLYHHMGTYSVVRGRQTEEWVALKSLFCRVTVSVEGLSKQNENWYGVEISGVPAGFSYEGELSESTISVVPVLHYSASGLQGNCCIYRMANPEGVVIRLREDRPNGSSALLFEKSLTSFFEDIDMSQPDISIPICIRLHRDGATISIRDWEDEMDQIEVVG